MTLLFDVFERTDMRISRSREHPYLYLNISAHPVSNLLRATLEQWFAEYPNEYKDELKGGFIAASDCSAFTELLVHRFLKQINADSIVIHPNIPGSEKKPDFKAVLGNQEVFIEVKNSIREDNPRIWDFYDGLNKSYSTTGYMLDLSFEGRFESPISVKKFIRFLEAQLEEFDATSLVEAGGGHDETPTWVFDYREDKIHVRLIPCQDPQKVYDSPIGIISPYSASITDDAGTLRKSLKKKASRYGDLDAVYLIAVNFEEGFLGDIDIAQALFGTEIFALRGHGMEPDSQRKNDGLWAKNRNTRVSGVLVINGANPWSFWKKEPVLWLNPWSSYPLDITSLKGRITIKAVNEKTGKLETIEGLNFSEILALDIDEWEEAFRQ